VGEVESHKPKLQRLTAGETATFNSICKGRTMSDYKIEIAKGWGWPQISRKAHYFEGGRSLCGKMLYTGLLEQGNDESQDNCAECKKRLAKSKPKQ
jgi:hypothetical protein